MRRLWLLLTITTSWIFFSHSPWATADETQAVTLDFSKKLQQLDGADGASVCQFHGAKPDGSAAVVNVAYSPLEGFPNDDSSTEFGKFCDTAFSSKGMGLSQLWVTPCPIQTPPGSVGDHYRADAWLKLDFSMYEPNVLLPSERYYNTRKPELGTVRGHTVAMLKAALHRVRAEGNRLSIWTDVHTDYPPWMWKDGLRKNPVRDEMFEAASLHTVYFIKYLVEKYGVPIHAASFANEPDMPGRHRFSPEQLLRGAKILREKLDEAGLNGVRVMPCTAISLSKVHLDWAKTDADTLNKLVDLLQGPMKEYAPYVDILAGHGSQSEPPIGRRTRNTAFWRASGDFNEHWQTTVGFDMGPPAMIDEVIRHNTWLYSQHVAQVGIWQVASRMGIGTDFFKMPAKFDPEKFGRPEAINGAAVVYPHVRPGMWVVGGSLGCSAREPFSVDGFTGVGHRGVIVITNDGQEREFKIQLQGTRSKSFEVHQATVGGRKTLGHQRADACRLTLRVPANSITTLVASEAELPAQVMLVYKDAAAAQEEARALLKALGGHYTTKVISEKLSQREQDSFQTKRHPVDPFGTAAYVLMEPMTSQAAARAHRAVMAPVVALGEANAKALGLKIGDRIEAGAPLSLRDELDPPAQMLEGGLPKACGRRVALPARATAGEIAIAVDWATAGQAH